MQPLTSHYIPYTLYTPLGPLSTDTSQPLTPYIPLHPLGPLRTSAPTPLTFLTYTPYVRCVATLPYFLTFPHTSVHPLTSPYTPQVRSAPTLSRSG